MPKYTGIPNRFIEQFMPTAAGEFVKIYIYLLKCLNENTSELSISRIADVFNNTEKDTIRALKYWDRKGLLKLTIEDGVITTLTMTLNDEDEEEGPAPLEDELENLSVSVSTSVTDTTPVKYEKNVPAGLAKRQYSKSEIEEFSKSEDVREFIFVAQKLLGRQLSGNDINTLMFFYDELHFKTDLIEYLLEYCVNAGHKSMRYIEKTAIAWAEQGIRDVNTAKIYCGIYSESCYPIMKAFGISGRKPAASEMAYINKWVISYGFETKMIVEAAERTINTIHQASFEYADSILYNWKSRGAMDLEAVEALDKEHKSAKKGKKSKGGVIKTDFNNFDQRDYDFDELKKKLLQQ